MCCKRALRSKALCVYHEVLKIYIPQAAGKWLLNAAANRLVKSVVGTRYTALHLKFSWDCFAHLCVNHKFHEICQLVFKHLPTTHGVLVNLEKVQCKPETYRQRRYGAHFMRRVFADNSPLFKKENQTTSAHDNLLTTDGISSWFLVSTIYIFASDLT